MTGFDHQRGKHFDVDGARIYAESIGASDAPILVLLHGGFGNMEDFNPLVPALVNWRLIGIDSRGHGASTLGNEPWTYERVQLDVESVLNQLGVTRCTLLGFSDGGIVSLRMATKGRAEIDRIVVVGATWHSDNLKSSKELLQGVTAESWRKKFPGTYEAYERLNPEPNFERFTKALVKGWLDETSSGHPNDTVTSILAPVLVIRGDDDHLTTLEDTVALRKKLANGHFLGIPFAGHVAYADSKDIFLHAVRQFLLEE